MFKQRVNPTSFCKLLLKFYNKLRCEPKSQVQRFVTFYYSLQAQFLAGEELYRDEHAVTLKGGI